MRFRDGCVHLCTLACLSLLVLLSLGFVQGIGGWVGYFGSTRPWLCLCLAIASIVLAAARARRRAGLFGFLALLGSLTTILPAIIEDISGSRLPNDDLELQVLAWNVYGVNLQGASVAARLVDQPADIVVLTEAHPLAPHWNDLLEVYPYRAGCPEAGECIFAILSRFPLTQIDVVTIGNVPGEPVVSAVLTVDGRDIGIAAVHLEKPWVGRKAIVQLGEFQKVLDRLPKTRIIVGDFNSASWAPDLAHFIDEEELHVAWFEPATWPVLLGAFGIPIDHIYTGGAARVASVSAFSDPLGSNHRAILGTVVVHK